ncbi:MAG TPA: TetR family transcriptional regulator [Solirubrobacter sp.]|nr:TetR family transcriptional regulator [Solirubrobacter sp.]
MLRADAARNLHRIVEVAARVFADDPGAGMAEVAAAAGVGRATVYRHFPTREALVEAIRDQALRDAEQALAECRLDEGSATDALRRLCAAWLEVAERYALTQPQRERRPVLSEPLIALFERGRAGGEFSPELPAQWMARAFGALLLAGARDGTESEVVFRTLLRGVQA